MLPQGVVSSLAHACRRNEAADARPHTQQLVRWGLAIDACLQNSRLYAPARAPAAHRAVLHLSMRDKWDELKAAVDAGEGDSRVAGLVRELVQMERQSEALENADW